MSRALDLLFERLAVFVAGAALALALGVMAAQVVCRYLLDDSLVWSEEVARYALVWSSMVGAAVAYRQGGHVAITNLVERLPARLRLAVSRVVHLLILGFGGLVAWTGWALSARNFARHQLSAALQIDIAWVNLAIPVGGALIAVAAIEAIVTAAKPSAGVSTL
ncbi:TRAP transporter small permease [Reyranella sp.]|uniref:TRAP transporter small permease n=1 Tax=Reyranella sp. TaxID=1929291 RepID=UPI003BAD8810